MHATSRASLLHAGPCFFSTELVRIRYCSYYLIYHVLLVHTAEGMPAVDAAAIYT